MRLSSPSSTSCYLFMSLTDVEGKIYCAHLIPFSTYNKTEKNVLKIYFSHL